MPALVPLPASIRTDASADDFLLTPDARLVADDDARATAELAVDVLRTATGLTLAVSAGPARDGDITLRVIGSGSTEAYELRIEADGVRISGADEAGLFYGVHTLAQLLRPSGTAVAPGDTADTGTAATPGAAAPGDTGNTATAATGDTDATATAAPGDTDASAPTTAPSPAPTSPVTAPAVTIADAPRFAYRGVMLDVARHFFPVETVLGYIDRAAALKFNALHLHLSDDQGWRIQIDSRPELTARASGTAIGGDAGGYYTKADYARIVAHAASRHMIVVPEIDGPSHTHAVGLAYPELAEPVVLSDAVLDTVRTFGGGMPTAGEPYQGLAVGFSSLKTRDAATYAFLQDVYGELAELTPGPYLHVGGDEAHGTDPADFAEYMRRVTALVAGLGKTPIAWHEAGTADDLAPSTIGQYWGYVAPTDGADEKARTFVRAGSKLILSPADAIYLDQKYDADTALGLTWANGPTSVHDAYAWDPAAVVAGAGEDAILGIEAPLWAETMRTAADIDTLAFPRIAAAAEIAWSAAPGPDAPERTWDSFRERVGALSPLWTRAGIAFFRSPEIAWADR
ncbi:beta-N-acetylhexosaminidase [Microbacterium luticocti]|uniref:beta-N-acetylhexosaminidase n=1 Tax=Microbacterium luticocti TaxID=451764 RepID=UPI0003F9159D|nr:beta-N-acetylhexosaminidase [Microbacterium luticocti]